MRKSLTNIAKITNFSKILDLGKKETKKGPEISEKIAKVKRIFLST